MIKRLLKCVREYKRDTILTPLFMVGEVLFECLIPYLMSENILGYLARYKNGGTIDVGEIVRWGVILILCALGSLTCGTMSGLFGAKASAGFAKNLRHDLFYKIQDFSFSNIDSFSTNSLVTRLTTDVTNVQMAFMMLIRIAVRAPMMMIVSLFFSISLYPKVGYIYLIVIPVLIVGLGLIIRFAMPLFNRIFKKYDALNESVRENVKGMRVVKSYVREDYEQKKFGTAAEEVRMNFTKAERIVALNSPIMMMCMYATTLAILMFCGYAGIFNNDIGIIGNLSSLITYSTQLLSSFMMLSMIFVMATLALASAKRIDEVLCETSDIKNPENPLYDIKDGSIEFSNVNFKYSEKAERFALKNINLKINSGETIGIIGTTGSSKTSLINLISRLYDVTDGTVKVGGEDVRNYDLKALRDAVSVVLQKNILFSGTIKDNLRWGDLNAADEEIEHVCKLAQADEFIQTFPDKYDTYIEQGGSNVSGGQKQRLCIARALLKKPKVLILDDSTSAVDTHTDALIRSAFATEIPNTTKIIIAQRISSVINADKIIILENGEIDGIGTHDELIKSNEIYKEIYSIQNNVTEKEAE